MLLELKITLQRMRADTDQASIITFFFLFLSLHDCVSCLISRFLSYRINIPYLKDLDFRDKDFEA